MQPLPACGWPRPTFQKACMLFGYRMGKMLRGVVRIVQAKMDATQKALKPMNQEPKHAAYRAILRLTVLRAASKRLTHGRMGPIEVERYPIRFFSAIRAGVRSCCPKRHARSSATDPGTGFGSSFKLTWISPDL